MLHSRICGRRQPGQYTQAEEHLIGRNRSSNVDQANSRRREKRSWFLTAARGNYTPAWANQGVDRFTPAGFRFTVVSDFPQVWQIFGTTNLNAWDFLGNVTNSAGEVQFLDSGALSRSRRFYKATP